MRSLYELKDKLCGELDELASKPDMSLYDLDTVHKLTDTIKNIDKIMMLEEEGENSRGARRDHEDSYANRGKHYVRGHYSREDGRGMSRDDGRMMHHLESMMNEARDEGERERISRFMDEMRR